MAIVADKTNYRKTQPQRWVVDERCAKVVIWFQDAGDDADFHQNLIITFWPIYNVP